MNFTPENAPDPMFIFKSETEKTFQYDETCPALPLPDLHQTLRKYLESVKPHVSEQEYNQTEFIVQQFESGIGKELHKKLTEKAKKEKNWLEKWWEDSAYLEGRYPTAPLVNFAGPGPYMDHYFPKKDGTQLFRAAYVLHSSLLFWQLLRKEQLRPDKDSKGNHMTMCQFRRAFSTCKIPGVHKDALVDYFKTESQGSSPTHVIVICKGRFFSFTPVDQDENPMTIPEIQLQLQRVQDRCKSLEMGPGIAALTGDERTRWAETRSRLIALHPDNYHNLLLIQSSICTMVLSDDEPCDESELYRLSLGGDPTNVWFDKGLNLIAYKNGLLGSNCDHAPVDAMVLVTNTFFNDVFVMHNKGKWQGSKEIRDMAEPTELKFKIDNEISKTISDAKNVFQKSADDLVCLTVPFTGYGRRYLRRKKLHPDTHVQLALQLSFYKLHKRPPPTYETATTRKYYNARTETMRSCTMEAFEWAKAMVDSKSDAKEKLHMYLRAADKHNRLMSEAQNAHGCDRHLLGLLLTAKEEGLPTPLLFQDKSFTKSGGGGNFDLSTSFVGYTTVYGGVAPMTANGYGTFYKVEQDRIVPVITTWKSSTVSNANMFSNAIHETLHEMKELLETAEAYQAKL